MKRVTKLVELWQVRAQMFAYIYWNRKTTFEIESTSYPKWCMFAVEEGEFSYRIGDESGIGSAGDLVLCPPETLFQRRIKMPLSFHYFHFDWVHRDTGEVVSAALAERHLLPCRLPLARTNRLQSVFGYLRSFPHASVQKPVLRWVEHMVDDLLFMFMTERHLVPLRLDSPTTDPLMDQAALTIRQHAFEELNLHRVASAYGLTPVQFSRRFTAAFKMTAHDYLTTLRLERACKLLQETALNLEDIAEKCGYRNGSYISRLFAKKLNTTPSAFRAAHRL
ncbi:AraC family transcriptional regulator [Paenibacillus ginsengarvi]|nr:AraC family transcriptional regulator [Paenibacillus ginsengarvi]